MYVLVDIGGTKTRFAISRDRETVENTTIVPTSALFDEAVERFREMTHELSGGEQIDAIGIAIRGPLNRDKTTLISDIYLTDWVGRPIKEALSSACAAPVYLENDANLVGIGEAMVGAGKGARIVGYMTVSTGVGGARIVEGHLDEVSVGFEPGKQIIDPDNSLCPDCHGNRLEDYISGRDVEERFGKPAYEIGDQAVWEELAEYLSIGLHNTIVHFSPDIMVLGGSMITGDPAIPLEYVEHRVRETLVTFPEPPRIVKAVLGEEGGLHGARIYLNQQLQGIGQ